ncbi:QcrA and Rieske domain-containing protein [Ornithinibacillus halotolerans]|uniref:Menaquinol:cytochrome c reductase iron-sulfur subunit n=1 Tax=Ornithinibacillus halotolerans TaxID=1274357 RepID=A0A916RN37_9BACI|nr:ubiquinol-cytochrome c reductase iron-sulfur subunit [Ornithinibacillus halotolerans]GGA61381.1 menaquinol-cytochrome C reductase iron-sulfur subunit [Ornithinibacillus halotolerans]
MSEEKQQVSRRQFLNYSLMGVGGFMAAGLLVSPIRMAIDPVLKKTSSAGEFVNVGLAVEDITTTPQRVDWQIDQVDGWYESKPGRSAWVYKNEKGDIVALSPVCTHLGCVVSWEGSDKHQNEFFCPCHDGRYTKDGVNIPGTPPLAPLSVYEHKVENGMLFLGKEISRKGA